MSDPRGPRDCAAWGRGQLSVDDRSRKARGDERGGRLPVQPDARYRLFTEELAGDVPFAVARSVPGLHVEFRRALTGGDARALGKARVLEASDEGVGLRHEGAARSPAACPADERKLLVDVVGGRVERVPDLEGLQPLGPVEDQPS
jgi:hypothetical protein